MSNWPEWTSPDGRIRLINADCLEVLPFVKADAVVTDPPYGIQANKAGAHSSIRDNPAWERGSWDDCRPEKSLFDQLLKFDEVAIWGGNFFADLLPASSAWLAWIKPEAETGFSLADMELCWTNKSFAARTMRWRRRDGNLHPTQKPVRVFEWTLSFIDSKTILDPFAGSCTTAVACIRSHRSCICIEREASYFEIGIQRVKDEYARTALFNDQEELATA